MSVSVFVWSELLVRLRLPLLCPGMPGFTASFGRTRMFMLNDIHVYTCTQKKDTHVFGRYSNINQEGRWWSINVRVEAIKRMCAHKHMHVYTHSPPSALRAFNWSQAGDSVLSMSWMISLCRRRTQSTLALSLSLHASHAVVILLFQFHFPLTCLHLSLSILLILM